MGVSKLATRLTGASKYLKQFSIINAEIFTGSDLCVAAYIDNIKSYVHSLQPADGIPNKTHDEIKTFTDKFLPDKTIQKKYLSANGRLYYYNGEVIHLVAYDDTPSP